MLKIKNFEIRCSVYGETKVAAEYMLNRKNLSFIRCDELNLTGQI